MLQDVYNLLSSVSINQSIVEKIVIMSSKFVAIQERWSRVLVIGYKSDNLKAENYSAIYLVWKRFVL